MTDEIDLSSMTDDQLAGLMAEAEPSQEPEAEQEAPAPSQEPPRKEPQHVPLAELLEERGRRKEAQARMDEMERRFSEFQARAQEYVANLQQAKPEPPAASYEEDPIEYLRQQQAAVAANLEAMRQHQQQLAQRQAADRQWSAMREAVGQAETAFASRQPDYWEAVNFLKSARQQQLVSQGASEQQAAAIIQQDAIAVANEAGRLGFSPAEYAYRIAVGSGYTPKQAQAARAAVAAQEAPKSLGGASGRSDAATPSLADISRLSDKDFDAMFAKMMGGT